MSRDSETVSKNMRSIHSKDTSIELQLRKALWHKGYRYPLCHSAFLSWSSMEVSLLWIFCIFLDTISGSRDIDIFTTFV